MSAIAEPAMDAAAGDRLARRNALVLAVAQALAGGNNTVLVATAGIVGSMLAPDKGLATLPISIFVMGMWIGDAAGRRAVARRFGRRATFQIGTACGVLTGLICCVAVLQGSFLLFNIGAVFSGFYASAHQAYRFAAADTASEAFQAKGSIVGADRRNIRGRARVPRLSSSRRISGRPISSPRATSPSRRSRWSLPGC